MTFTSDIPSVIETLQKEGRLPTTLTKSTMDAIEKSLQRYAVKISQMKLQQACDMVKDIAEQALKTEQGVGAAGGTVTTGLNPASSRGVLDIGLKSLDLESIGETMNMGFFLRIASDVADGAGKMLADNFDQETVDFYPAWEFTRLDEVEVPRGTEVVKGVVQTWNGWDDPNGRWVAACEEAGDDDALEVFHSTGRMVALKSSDVWQALGDGAGGYTDTLGNSFPPFAFNSGMYRDNVSRHEAVDLGLMDDLDENGDKTVAEPAKIDFKDLLNFEATGKLAASLAHRALMAGAPMGNKNARKDHVAQTETKEFKAWFGDSKVVDKNGKPLVVYHGAPRGFSGDSFDESRIGDQNDRTFNPQFGEGFYFSTAKTASEYAGDKGQVVPAYLKIENPLLNDEKVSEGQVKSVRDLLSKSEQKDFDRSFNIPAYGSEEKGYGKDLYRSLQNSYKGGELEGKSEGTAADRFATGILKKAGFDGVIQGKLGTDDAEIVVFHPTQIKSAIGNKGTWSRTDPNITARSAASEEASLLALEARFAAKGFTIEAGEGVPA